MTDEPKRTQINFRLTPAERAHFEKQAAANGLSISKYIKATALLNAPKQPRIGHDDAAQLRYELRKIGNNVNQLAHAANVNGELPTADKLDVLSKQVTAIWEQLK